MMGSITDAPDGKAVAGSVFAAVGVYGVSISPPLLYLRRLKGVGEEDADIRAMDRSSSSSAGYKHSCM
jgi:hypothetical protein